MTSLKSLGLSDYEEKTYLALHKIGRSEVKEISKVSQVPPTAVYPNLKSLVLKGLVQMLESDPVQYEAIEPKLALRSLVDRKKMELDQNLTQALEEVKSIPVPLFKKKDPISVSLGREMSENIFEEFSKKAKKEIFIMGWSFRTHKSPFRVIKITQKLMTDQVDFRLITSNKDHGSNPALVNMKKLGVKLKFNSMENFSIQVRDGEEAKITLKNKELEQRINIHIEDKDLSLALREYFLSVWEKAKKI